MFLKINVYENKRIPDWPTKPFTTWRIQSEWTAPSKPCKRYLFQTNFSLEYFLLKNGFSHCCLILTQSGHVTVLFWTCWEDSESVVPVCFFWSKLVSSLTLHPLATLLFLGVFTLPKSSWWRERAGSLDVENWSCISLRSSFSDLWQSAIEVDLSDDWWMCLLSFLTWLQAVQACQGPVFARSGWG